MLPSWASVGSREKPVRPKLFVSPDVSVRRPRLRGARGACDGRESSCSGKSDSHGRNVHGQIFPQATFTATSGLAMIPAYRHDTGGERVNNMHTLQDR